MSAHAILSLRGLKHGEEWDKVWEFLERRHGFRPLPLDAAVEAAVASLSELPVEDASEDPSGHRLRNVTALELIRDAHLIGLRQDHLKRLAGVVAPDEERRAKVLEQAAEHLGWNTEDLRPWEEISEADPVETLTEVPSPTVLESAPPDSTANFFQSMQELNLLADSTALDLPSCSAVNVPGGQDGATTVYGEFAMAASLDDLRYATDPENWPTCSWFFISMTQQGQRKQLPPPDDVGDSAGYDAYETVFEELVGIENMLTVRTSLTTRYFVGSKSVGMEFDLAPGLHGDGKLDVDHGYLLAERHPTEANKVIVKSQKTFSFVGLDDLPFSFLCEFGWIDMMRAMAQCRKPAGGGP